MTATLSQAQSEYDDLRRRRPSRLAFLASPRLVILPDRLMRLYGGAAVLYRWTCIGRGLLEAPPEIRTAMLAHEWGHVVRGHALFTTTALIALICYLTVTTTGTALCALLVIGTCLCWVTQSTRELEADDVAVELVGAGATADGLTWCVDRYARGKPANGIKARLERLRQMRFGGK